MLHRMVLDLFCLKMIKSCHFETEIGKLERRGYCTRHCMHILQATLRKPLSPYRFQVE